MATLYHQVWINASTAKVYAAIATEDGIGGWWNPPTVTRSDEGVTLEFSPGAEHGVLKARVVAMIPGEGVEWEFVSTHPAASPASAWTGTRATFAITRREVPPWSSERVDMAILDFRHSGWDETNEYFGFCNFGWGETLQKLKRWCEAPDAHG